MMFNIPEPMKLEHNELHVELSRGTEEEGSVGAAAREVARVLHAHFEKEEEYALPPLGLLTLLASGEVRPEMADVLEMTDRLKAELPEMLEEHRAIVGALEGLISAAKAEGKPEYARFAEKLMLHARTEEEVSYPTAILIGEYLKLMLKS